MRSLSVPSPGRQPSASPPTLGTARWAATGKPTTLAAVGAAGDAVAAIGRRLEEAGYESSTVNLDGIPALVARRSDFRWRWFGTRLHTFVFVAAFDHPTRAQLDRFATLASRYATANKGGLPRGLQTGTAAVSVAVVDHVREEVLAWADRRGKTRFAAIGYPVLAEASTGKVLRPARMVAGASYASHLRSVADLVGEAIRTV